MSKVSGKVILVGAGPGDPELITIKGIRALEQADCVVYDYLASSKLLKYAPVDADRIYVGKRAGLEYISQSDINSMLIKYALDGHCVVRLKGGDPYIFGRGGEEVQALFKAGVPFEVVPGIPAAVGLAAYTGIPLTDRNHASQVTFVTGHQKNDEADEHVDWECLAKQPGTLVIYMGCHSIHKTTAALIEYGKDPATPASIVQWATTPQQRTVVATLGTLADEMDARGIEPPALVVVGDVNELRDELSWFEQKPLFGKHIVVTRSQSQSSSLVDGLAELGAAVFELPVISIEPIPSNERLRHAATQLSQYDWVVFTSTNGVDAFMAELTELGLDARAFAGTRIAAVGKATTHALASFGLIEDLRPETASGKAVFEALSQRDDLTGKTVLMPRSEIAHSDLPDLCREAGAHVDDIPAYRTFGVPFEGDELLTQLRQGQIDGVTFTSGSTVDHFFNQLDVESLRNELTELTMFSIGPVTSKSLAEYGFKPACESSEANISGFIRSIADYYSKNK